MELLEQVPYVGQLVSYVGQLVSCVGQLVSALWSLKGMYDQHCDNMNEIKSLLDYIQDNYEDHKQLFPTRLKEAGVPDEVGKINLKNLDTVMGKVTIQLQEWATDRSLLCYWTSEQRMQDVERLRLKVMASFHESLLLHQLKASKDIKEEIKDIKEEMKDWRNLLQLRRTSEPVISSSHSQPPSCSLSERSVSHLQPAVQYWPETLSTQETPPLSSQSPSRPPRRFLRRASQPMTSSSQETLRLSTQPRITSFTQGEDSMFGNLFDNTPAQPMTSSSQETLRLSTQPRITSFTRGEDSIFGKLINITQPSLSGPRSRPYRHTKPCGYTSPLGTRLRRRLIINSAPKGHAPTGL